VGLARLLTQARLTRAITVALALAMLAVGAPLLGWNQKPHRQINFEATKVFFERATEEGSDKSSTMFIKPVGGLAEAYQLGEGRHAMAAWITLGGDWADEPHLYASVRHFYDPLRLVRDSAKRVGVAYLTDQYWAHGNYDSPAIDAVTWGLEHPDNPFCLKQGMVAYKLALETPEGLPPATSLVANHFKTNISLVPKDAADQRSLYLARAYRALGEAMHLIGDMTQPAHVRNDSHPMDEPIETGTYSSHAKLAAANPLIDSRIQPFLASAGGVLQTPRALAHELAVFTNRYFYSMDTIYDKPSYTWPNNGMARYPSPQFSDLRVEKATIRGFVGPREVKRLFARVAGRDVPMAQERLAFHWFDPDHSLIFGNKLETIGRASSVKSKLGPYMIPSAFAREQAAVLLPVAIHACADLMDLFFPTLELQANYRPEGLASGAGGGAEASGPQVISIEPTMVHHRKRDPAWEAFGLSIEYTGPGALVITQDGEVEATRKLHFKKGKLETIENAAGKMVEGPLRVYVPSGRGGLSGEQEFYAFERDQKLHLEIEAGSRRFESPPYELEHEVVIMPRIAVGPPGATFDFEAYARPEGHYRFEWEWPGMGEAVATEGSTSEVAPVLTEEGEYPFTVKLVHGDGTVLAEDRVTAWVEEEEDELPTPTPNPEHGRWVLVRQWTDVWKSDREERCAGLTAEAGPTSARIHVGTPASHGTGPYDFAMSWDPLPTSMGWGENVEIALRFDSAHGSGDQIWGAELAVCDGVLRKSGDAPCEASWHLGCREYPSNWWTVLDKDSDSNPDDPDSSTTEVSFRYADDDGETQVVTIHAWGAGGGCMGAAVHVYYEYRFQE